MHLHNEFGSLADMFRRQKDMQPLIKQPAPTAIRGRAALINMLVSIISKGLPDAPEGVLAWILDLIEQDHEHQAKPAKIGKNETAEDAQVRLFLDGKTRDKADARRSKLLLALDGLNELRAEYAYAQDQKRISELKRELTEAWKVEELMMLQAKRREEAGQNQPE